MFSKDFYDVMAIVLGIFSLFIYAIILLHFFASIPPTNQQNLEQVSVRIIKE